MPHPQASGPGGKSHRQRHTFPKGEADSKDVDDAVMDSLRGLAELRGCPQGKKILCSHTKMPGKSESQILGKVRQKLGCGADNSGRRQTGQRSGGNSVSNDGVQKI